MKKLFLASTMALFGFCAVSAQTQKAAEAKPTVYVVSNAHFDTQWNWDVQTSISEYVPKTIRQNLMLMEKYPNYIFNFEGGIKYSWMKEYFPYEYELVKQRIKEGRWHVTGSTWDANDANIPSTESTTRNILYGQTFYRDEFGVQGMDIFLPDCFGFGYTLPSIAAHSGLIGFSTQKLQWRHKPFYENGLKIPFEFGIWEGVDGAKVMLVADGRNYTTKWNNEDLSENQRLLRSAEKAPNKTIYHYFGTGDTGGSPTIETVQTVEKSVVGKGAVKIISATSDQLYKDYLPFDKHPELPQFKGELLMDVHATGCYTSQAAMKLFNRRNEQLGDAAERAAVAADWLGAVKYPKVTLTEAWKRFVWHQFHDDLTGTSIPRAYEFSWNDELISLKQFENVLSTSVGAVSRGLNTADVKGTPIVLFNPNGFNVSENIEITVSAKANEQFTAYDETGKAVATQLVKSEGGNATLLVAVKLSPLGYAVYDVRKGKPSAKTVIAVSANSLENSVYKIALDKNGDISSIFDKKNNRELVENGKAIRLALFTSNESFSWPAWEIMKSEIDKNPVSIDEKVKISVAEKGVLRSAIKVERTYGKSVFVQYIRLTEGAQADRIDIVNEIDWQSTNTLLKAEFPLAVANPDATYDLGLGSVKRGNNTDIKYEVFAQKWADLTDKSGAYGVAVLNDCKYGWDKPNDNTIRLTLLHTPKTQGGYRYQDHQDFGKHYFTYSIVGHTGEYAKAGIVNKAEVLNQQPVAYIAPKHKGNAKAFSFLKTNNENILVKAVKQAEKSDEYVIRVYETSGEKQSATLTFPAAIASAKETNGVEDVKGAANIAGNDLKFDITPFSLKTFKIKLADAGKMALTKVQTTSVTLPYDTKSASYNAFRRDVNFDGKGNSLAAELFPKKVDFKGIPFTFADAAEANAVKCRGQVIDLPTGNYNRLYLLAAATSNDTKTNFAIDGKVVEVVVPSYKAFIGQWGHYGHTEGFMKTTDIAVIGTHRHGMSVRHDNANLAVETEDRVAGSDLYYEFSYIFAIAIDLPKGAAKLTLPENSKIAIFSASIANDENNALTPAVDLLGVHLPAVEVSEEAAASNYLFNKKVIAKSGETNTGEKAEFAIDEDPSTKWCDAGNSAVKFIAIDLGQEREIHGWSVFHAALESRAWVTRDFALQIKQNENDEWKTIDSVTGNKATETERKIERSVKARFVRLNVTSGEQSGNTARIYDFQVW